MIFLTIGTHEPFDRLVRSVDDWVARSGGVVFGQITERGTYHPRHFEWTAQMPPEEYNRRCAEAEFLVAHAGMGSIITALTLRKPIVVMPRRGHLGETRNDHQYSTVLRLGTRPGIFVADDETGLPAVLDHVQETRAAQHVEEGIRPYAEDSLIAALRGMMFD